MCHFRLISWEIAAIRTPLAALVIADRKCPSPNGVLARQLGCESSQRRVCALGKCFAPQLSRADGEASWSWRGSDHGERAALAQLVEHRIRNAEVVSSSLTSGTTLSLSLSTLEDDHPGLSARPACCRSARVRVLQSALFLSRLCRPAGGGSSSRPCRIQGVAAHSAASHRAASPAPPSLPARCGRAS